MDTYTATLMGSGSVGSGTLVPGIEFIDGEPAEQLTHRYTTPEGEARLTVWHLAGNSGAPLIFEYSFVEDRLGPVDQRSSA